VEKTRDDAPVTLVRCSFGARHLRRLRLLVASTARRVGLGADRGQDLALAVTEAAGNVVKYGGDTGQFELIRDDNRALIAQISDHGPGMTSPTPGSASDAESEGGRGLRLIDCLCDRVDYRTGPAGTTVRMEVNLNIG
jgi:serine/threonine-protein kinase RsbW